MLMELAI
jgi:hypothetical protein